MSLTLNGKAYPLRFTVNALCRLEEETGLRLSSLDGDSLSCLRGLLWCGLMERLPSLTLTEAGDLIDAHLRAGGTLTDVAGPLADALADACFFPKAGRESPPQENR